MSSILISGIDSNNHHEKFFFQLNIVSLLFVRHVALYEAQKGLGLVLNDSWEGAMQTTPGAPKSRSPAGLVPGFEAAQHVFGSI